MDTSTNEPIIFPRWMWRDILPLLGTMTMKEHPLSVQQEMDDADEDDFIMIQGTYPRDLWVACVAKIAELYDAPVAAAEEADRIVREIT